MHGKRRQESIHSQNASFKPTLVQASRKLPLAKGSMLPGQQAFSGISCMHSLDVTRGYAMSQPCAGHTNQLNYFPKFVKNLLHDRIFLE